MSSVAPAGAVPVTSAATQPRARAAARVSQSLPGRAICARRATFHGAAVASGALRVRTPRASAPRGVVSAAASTPAPTESPNGLLAGIVEGGRARLAADPNFLFKLGVEVGMDEAITLGVNLAARGNPLLWSTDVLLQVVCQCFVACFNDLALVWCLAPTGAPKAAEEDPALSMAHVFQPGDFTVAQRAATWVRKWRLYSVIGAATGFLSMALTGVLSRDASLLAVPLLARAALTGCLHLGVSANTRYQLVNGAEVLLYRALPTGVARLGSIAVRFGNNCAGARLWIALSAALAAVWKV